MKDRISGREDKIDIKGKTDEFLDKRLKSCERNMQELCNSIKSQTCESWELKKEKR
jgi:hypothetical protein